MAATAHAATWSTIGSGGAVDDDDLDIVDLAAGEVRVAAAAPAGSVANVRYNIVSLEGFSGLQQVYWEVRFRDNGPDAQVRLSLRQYNKTGSTSNLALFDSNDHPASGSYQNRTECIGLTWDFNNGPFYIEAELIKSGVGGAPALGIVMLTNTNCTP